MRYVKTDRLTLKPLQDRDKARLVALIGDFDVAINLSRVPYPYSLADADDWLSVVESEEFNLSIFLDDALIGAVGLSEKNNGSCELGYWVGKTYWGRGIATEAARGLLDWALPRAQPDYVAANVFADNPSSARVLEKLGFVLVGEDSVFSLSRQAHVPTLFYRYELSH